MRIVLNGEPTEIPPTTTVADLVRDLGHDPTVPGVAVALDGEVLRRLDWRGTPVPDGAQVEIVTAVQGGAR